ncbi:NAD(P)H-dependent oxidoreductase [Aquimarina muelleri]|uniref:NAD(P)H-dependent oxidoreductase n=1 Tax=Aquimarina muelleri TaxID=279356 RepID=A0A918JV24_9FLAO|nr:NAD(P)H-dependent oxidoreductase [Aquimarina muelleri]MCX2762986.1 NAD(P)H-dependent oxidoreductase [Aquimarina muelleri]GGX15238.1 NAD(P)H-dependent oxidoreductase [Aquimarina muelleri]
MNIIESLRWRYATKKFDNKKILPQEKINTITEAFNLTATSYGLQPLKLVIIKDKVLQKELTTHSWNQQQVADASHLLVFCIEKNIGEQYINEYFNNVKAIRNTPDEILNPFKKQLVSSFKNKSPEEIYNWATKQAYLAMGNILTICAIEAIDSCPMEGFIPEKYDETLNLSNHNLSSVLVLPIGYRAKDDMFSEFKKVRRSINDTIITI